MTIAILGFGREGQSLLKFLQRPTTRRNLAKLIPALKSWGAAKPTIWILDKDPNLKIPRGLKSVLGKEYLDRLEQFDLIFRSPGISYRHKSIERALRLGKTVSSATKLFFDAADKIGAQIIGVTGSKGKTTTATLIYEMLKSAKLNAHLGGNMGRPALDLLPKLKRKSWVVLELSSFQLQDLHVSPPIAVLLDVFPEHLDFHRSLAEYYAAKGNICRFQTAGNKAFYLGHNPITSWLAGTCKGQRIEVTERDFNLFTPADMQIRGQHHFRNAVIAARVAAALGVKTEIIQQTIRRFRGVVHRQEIVRETKGREGIIRWINDSASTNPHTAAAAVNAFRGTPHVLIAGGQDKNLDYRPLTETLRRSLDTKLVVLLGANREKIARSLAGLPIHVVQVKNLRAAAEQAYRAIKKEPGEEKVILFSPGATSFDMFKNYAERGEQFKKVVASLTSSSK